MRTTGLRRVNARERIDYRFLYYFLFVCILILSPLQTVKAEDIAVNLEKMDSMMYRYADIFEVYSDISSLHRKNKGFVFSADLFVNMSAKYRLESTNLSLDAQEKTYRLSQYGAAAAIPHYLQITNPLFPDTLGEYIYGNLFLVHNGLWMMNWDSFSDGGQEVSGYDVVGYSRGRSLAALEFTSYLSGLTLGLVFNKPFKPVYAGYLFNYETLYKLFIYPFIGADSLEGFVSFNAWRFTADTLYSFADEMLERYKLSFVVWKTLGEMSALLEQVYDTHYFGFDLESLPLSGDEVEMSIGAQTNYEFTQINGYCSATFSDTYTFRLNGWYNANGLSSTFDSTVSGDSEEERVKMFGGAFEYHVGAGFSLGLAYNDKKIINQFPLIDSLIFYGRFSPNF